MISVKANEADERKIAVHLDELPRRLRSALRPIITELTDRLLKGVHAAEPMRSGRLRAATKAFIDEKDDRISGKVRVVAEGGTGSGTHEAAAALEYGAHRSVMVSEHTERLSGKLKRSEAGGLVMVEAYVRRANIMARRFMRDPATAMRPEAMAELQRAISEARL